jgi:hypothetical protein
MIEKELTSELRLRIYEEIARISKHQFEIKCEKCDVSFAFTINLLASILLEKITIGKFLEILAENNAGKNMLEFYLNMFDI